MAKYCPVIKSKVVYLTCQECEEKLCERQNKPKEAKDTTTDKQTNSKKQS